MAKRKPLNENVRLVALQFSFSNGRFVPGCLPVRPVETIREHNDRKSRASGELIVEPTENASVVHFLAHLAEDGYELVDAFYQNRVGGNARAYHVVRFLFARGEHAHSSEHFADERDEFLGALKEMTETALWRVRAFRNPLYVVGEPVEGESALSINLEVRTPLFRPDGDPVVIWERDEETGEKIGDKPHPLRPEFELLVKRGSPKLQPVEA